MSDSSKTLSIKITAEDGASKTFQTVSSSAQTMADVFEQIVAEGGEAFDGVTESAATMGDAVESAARQGSAATQEMVATAREVEEAYKNVGQTLLAFGAGGVAGLALATSRFNDLQSAMANVNSIAKLSDGELAGLTSQVRDLAVELGKNPTELADGLYDLISSGVDAGAAMDVLRTSTVAAGAGLTNTATSARAITGVLNAYGLSVDKAGDVSDVLFKTVDSGVITFEALANNLGNTLSLASLLGVSIEELGAAYAEMTLQSINASQAETMIAAIMRSAINETEAMTAAVSEYGYASAEALIQSEGLAGYLEFLAEASGGSSGALLELLGTAEAATGALALMRNEGENFTTMLGDMQTAASDGAYTQGVFETQMDTTAAAMARLSAAAIDVQITIGQALSPVLAPSLDVLTASINRVNDYLNMLPESGQTAAAGLAAVVSAASLGAGSLILLAPRIVETRTALQTLGGVSGAARLGLGGLVGLVNPLTLGFVALTVAGVGVFEILQNIEESSSGVAEGIGMLADEVERLKLAAQPEAAEQVQSIVDAIQDQIDLLSGDTLSDIVGKLEAAGHEMGEITSLFQIEGLREDIKTAGQLMDEFSDHVIETANSLNSPEAQQAYLDWVNGLLATIEHTAEGSNLDEIIEQVLLTPASEVPGVMDAIEASTTGAADGLNQVAQAAAAAAAPVESLTNLFADFPAVLDDLRLDGQGQLASDLEGINKQIMAAFVIDAPVNPLSQIGIGGVTGDITASLQITEEQVTQLGSSWDRIMQGMQSGTLDNVALIADLNAILTDPGLSDTAQLAAITALSLGMSEYIDSAKAMQESQKEFLSNGDNILDFWLQYQDQVRAATFAAQEQNEAQDKATASVGDTVTPLEAAFEATVKWAMGMNDASDALDQALRTFGQIDSLAQRSASGASIADTLIGAPGELGTLQDLWERVSNGTSDAALSQEVYNQAISSGIAIQESNLRVQDDLNVVRAQQIPLLAQQQVAYEANIASLTTMTAQEQQHALMLQDSAVQAQIAQQYSLAYSASIGEIPEEVATEMIVNTAKADPAFASVLLNLGLIEEAIGPDGEKTFTVNIPDADATIGAINRMTIAFLSFQAAAEGTDAYTLAVEIYGEEEANDLFGKLDEADGQTSTSTLNVETTVNGVPGGIQAGLDAVRNMMGLGSGGGEMAKLDLEATVSLLPPDVGALTEWAAGETVEVPATYIWQGSVTGGDGTGGAMGPPEITVPVQGEWTGEIIGLPSSGDGSSTLEGLAQDVEITVTQVGMETVIGLAQATQNAVEGIPTTWNSSINETGAAGVIGVANATANAIEGIPTSWRTTISLSGAETAIGSAHAVANAIAAIPTSKTSTINVVTAYSSVGSPVSAQAHGGIPGFAGGGIPDWIPFYGAEGNRPELLHFANGGTAPIFTEGVYAVPPMTYVSPANANPGLSGGRSVTVHVHVQGDLVTREQLRLDIAEAIWAAEMEEDLDYLVSMGVQP